MALRYVLISSFYKPVCETNNKQITGYLSSGLVLTSLAVNSLVSEPQASKQAASAGYILLSMVNVSTFRISSGLDVRSY